MVEDGWQPTAHNATSITKYSDRPHDIGFSPHPVTSCRDPEIVATTEQWGDQLSWETGADLGMPISIFLLHKHRARFPLSQNLNYCSSPMSDSSS